MLTRYELLDTSSRVFPHVLPPYFAFHPSVVEQVPESSFTSVELVSDDKLVEVLKLNANGVPIRFPLSLKAEGGEWWTLPNEPLITVSGGNAIIKKQIAKGKVRGSIKERWTQEDYTVQISGIFINENVSYPEADVQKLRRLCEQGTLLVSSPIFDIFSISQIVVEKWNFPHTSGRRNQAFAISAVSDDIYKLLLKKDDLKQQ